MLLLAKGWSHREVRAITFASFDLISECATAFRQGGSAAVVQPKEEPLVLQRWLQQSTPQDFGYFRSRRSCAILAETPAWAAGIRVSTEAVRFCLAQLGWVWRIPIMTRMSRKSAIYWIRCPTKRRPCFKMRST